MEEVRGMSTEKIINMMKSIKGVQSNGLADSIEPMQQRINDAAENSQAFKNAVTLHDGYGNELLSIGENDQSAKFDTYGFENDTLNWSLWLSMYSQSWTFRRAIDKPAQDEVRCGISLGGTTNKDEVMREMTSKRSDFIQLLQWGALFGGSIAVVMFDNVRFEEMKDPMTEDQVKKSNRIRFYVVDRWYGVAPSYNRIVDDLGSIDFGKPEMYSVTFADGKTYEIHHSWILRYDHRDAPKLVKNGMLQGWGYAEGSHILGELMRDDKLKTSIQSLIDKSLIEVIKMDGMRGVFMGASQENQDQLTKRLEMVNWARNYNSLTFLDTNDSYEMNNFTGLSGLADLFEKNMWTISAALDMQGVLYGDLKNGMGNDQDALERYDETINNRCESYLRPVYEKYLKILYVKFGIDEKVDFTFNSLLMKRQLEKQVEDLKSFVDLSSLLLSDGVIDLKQYAKALQNYSTNGTIDFGLDEEAINKLDDKMTEEMENISLEQ